MENKKYVYLVRQTQPDDNYNEKTIAVYENKETAVELARQLNKEYGHGVRFDENYDYIEDDDDYDYDLVHYYDVESQEVNPNPEDYTWAIEK